MNHKASRRNAMYLLKSFFKELCKAFVFCLFFFSFKQKHICCPSHDFQCNSTSSPRRRQSGLNEQANIHKSFALCLFYLTHFLPSFFFCSQVISLKMTPESFLRSLKVSVLLNILRYFINFTKEVHTSRLGSLGASNDG